MGWRWRTYALASMVGLVLLVVLLGKASAAPLRVTAEQSNPAMLTVHLAVRCDRAGWARLRTEGFEQVDGPNGQASITGSAGRPYVRRVRLHKGVNRWRQPAFRYVAEQIPLERQLARHLVAPSGVVPVVPGLVTGVLVWGRACGRELSSRKDQGGGA